MILSFSALRRVISKYSATSLPPIPLNNKKTGFGRIQLEKTSSLFDTLDNDLSVKAIESESPISMEDAGQVFLLISKTNFYILIRLTFLTHFTYTCLIFTFQMFGFLLYASEYVTKGDGNTLSIPKVRFCKLPV